MTLEKIGKLSKGFNPKDLLGQTIWTQTPSGSKVQEKIIWTYILLSVVSTIFQLTYYPIHVKSFWLLTNLLTESLKQNTSPISRW